MPAICCASQLETRYASGVARTNEQSRGNSHDVIRILKPDVRDLLEPVANQSEYSIRLAILILYI